MNENAVPITNQAVPRYKQEVKPDINLDNNNEVQYLKKIYTESKLNMKDKVEQWDRHDKYYSGKQFITSNNKPTLNIIHQLIQWQLALLTDTDPSFNCLPSDPTDFEFSQMLSKLVENVWKNNNMQDNIARGIFDTLKYDTAIFKVIWNPDANDNEGEIEILNIDPRDIFISTGTIDFDKKCPYIMHRMVKTVGNLKRIYGEKAKNIRADYVKDKPNLATNKTEPYNQDYFMQQKNRQIKCDDRNLVEVLECWTEDNSLEEFIIETDEGIKETNYRQKYPRGKVTIWLPNQDVILDEYENPNLDGSLPFVKMINNIGIDQFWGDGEFTHLIQIQKQINNVLGNIISYINLTCSPKIITDSSNGVTNAMLTNKKGVILRTKPGMANTISYMQAPSPPAYIFNFLQILLNSADRTTGSSEVSQGRRAEGDPTSGVGINILKESTYQRIRLKERLHNAALNNIGKRIINLMLQYYNTPRMIRIANTDKGIPDYVEFYFGDKEGKKTLTKKDIKYNEETNTYETGEYIETPITKSIFDVRITTEYGDVMQKIENKKDMMLLLEKGMVSPERFIKSLNLPQGDNIIAEIEAKQAEAQNNPPQPQ